MQLNLQSALYLSFSKFEPKDTVLATVCAAGQALPKPLPQTHGQTVSIHLSKMYIEIHKIVPGGILMPDDYGIIEAETLAENEFIANKKGIVINKSEYHLSPNYIIKP